MFPKNNDSTQDNSTEQELLDWALGKLGGAMKRK